MVQIHLEESAKALQYWQIVYVDRHHPRFAMNSNRIRPQDYQVPTQQVMSSSSSNLIIDSCDCSCHSSSLDLSQDASSSAHPYPPHHCNPYGRSPTLSSSSPSRMVKSSGRRLQHLWSAVKKLSPVNKFKAAASSRAERNLLARKQKTYDEANRIYLSNPDLSVHDLASIARPRSHDDLDIIALSKQQKEQQQIVGVNTNGQPINFHTLPNQPSRRLFAQRNISLDSDPAATASDADSEQVRGR